MDVCIYVAPHTVYCTVYVAYICRTSFIIVIHWFVYTTATPSTDDSRPLTESQEIGDNYFAIGHSEQSQQGQQQAALNPETIEKNKSFLKSMDNFQVSVHRNPFLLSLLPLSNLLNHTLVFNLNLLFSLFDNFFITVCSLHTT